LKLVEKFGLEIFDIRKQLVHGGTLRIFVSKKGNYSINNSVKIFLSEEHTLGLDNIEFYHKFSTNVKELKKNLIELLTQLKKENKLLFGYGASAKGNVLLNYCNIDNHILEYIVDTTPLKQGKYTPGTHIPVFSPEKIVHNTENIALLLAWNYKSEILEKEKKFREKGGKFLIPIPFPNLI
jgi:small-conductance mechanosensitive channel